MIVVRRRSGSSCCERTQQEFGASELGSELTLDSVQHHLDLSSDGRQSGPEPTSGNYLRCCGRSPHCRRSPRAQNLKWVRSQYDKDETAVQFGVLVYTGLDALGWLYRRAFENMIEHPVDCRNNQECHGWDHKTCWNERSEGQRQIPLQTLKNQQQGCDCWPCCCPCDQDPAHVRMPKLLHCLPDGRLSSCRG